MTALKNIASAVALTFLIGSCGEMTSGDRETSESNLSSPNDELGATSTEKECKPSYEGFYDTSDGNDDDRDCCFQNCQKTCRKNCKNDNPGCKQSCESCCKKVCGKDHPALEAQ